MVAKCRTFTREFKGEPVQMLMTTDMLMAESAVDLGIHLNTLYKWVYQ